MKPTQIGGPADIKLFNHADDDDDDVNDEGVVGDHLNRLLIQLHDYDQREKKIASFRKDHKVSSTILKSIETD